MLFQLRHINVDEVDTGFDYGQLLSKNIDAQWAFRTTAGINLPARGIDVNVINPADYSIVTHGYVVIANDKTIKEKPELAQRFLNAVLDATVYMLDHPEEAIDATVARDPNFKRSVGESQMAIYSTTIKNNSPIGSIPKEAMDQSAKQMVRAGLLPYDFDVTKAYTPDFVDAYYKRQ